MTARTMELFLSVPGPFDVAVSRCVTTQLAVSLAGLIPEEIHPIEESLKTHSPAGPFVLDAGAIHRSDNPELVDHIVATDPMLANFRRLETYAPWVWRTRHKTVVVQAIRLVRPQWHREVACMKRLCLLATGIAALTVHIATAQEAITPFTIAVPSSVLADLKERLRRARFPEEIPGMNWQDGTDLTYLKQFVAYWRDKYDWRAHERRLNQFRQFSTTIDGVSIHFVHQRSRHPDATPMLLLNGWPSSFDEYSKVITPLVDPDAHGAASDPAFHVVVPSMPGFGFSGKRTTYGYTPDRIARMWATLMARLGYDRYVIAASDWGTFVGERVAMIDASHVRALYIQEICPTGNRRAMTVRQMPRWLVSMSGAQTSLPQTRGYGLSDSPVDLAAWILGAYKWLPDNGGNVEGALTRDEMLTNITIWWVTNSGTSAARLYYETTLGRNGELLEFFSGHHPSDPQWKVTVPTGCAMFPGQTGGRKFSDEERKAAQALAREHFNVGYWSEPARGGHFAAQEQPEIWLKDVRSFFTQERR